MEIVKLLSLIATVMPEIMRIIRAIQEKQKIEKDNIKVKEEMIKIANAFEEKNAKALNDIFNK
jgi:hypothetical protein